MHFLKIIFILFLVNTIYAKPLKIDDKTAFYDLLPSSHIYIDKTKALTIHDIKNKQQEFIKNDKKLLGYGYSPDFDVWVKFTLFNNTDKSIERTIEYDNSITSKIEFYEEKQTHTVLKDGLFSINSKRKTINPTFKIKLHPYKSKTYYIKTRSHITALIVKLNLWNNEAFYEKEIKHQLYLALFFGSMIILALYNLFIFFFTKDISYLYYVLYIVGLMLHHVIYVGFASIYFLNQEWIIHFIELSPLIVAFPIFALALFSKSFLHLKQYPKLNNILIVYLVIFPLFLFTIIINDSMHQYRNIFFISLLFYLISVTIYAAFKKNRQAYFILFGCVSILLAFIFMYLSSAGIFNIYEHFKYIIELSLIFEAIIFSIALADRINHLQKDKENAHKKLFAQQKNEQQRLEIKVTEKTKDLKVALDEKGLLLKELNHRVKNNMQTIVSLIRLQGDEIEDEKLHDIFLTIQNRINAMSHLHELLYKQDNLSYVKAYEYFDLIIEEIRESYDTNVDIDFDINTELKMEQAIYCGLILNELISNSFKYAFENRHGNINISLDKVDNDFQLIVYDDGIGYNQNKPSNSLGMVLVNTLAVQQLKGKINIDSTNGVRVEIHWSNDA